MSSTPHDDIRALLATFALDAVEPDEGRTIEQHIEGCDDCRAEVDHWRTAAGLMGSEPALPPDRVWNRIVQEIGVPEVPPMRIRVERVQRLSRRGRRVVSAAAAAVIVVIAIVGSLCGPTNPVSPTPINSAPPSSMPPSNRAPNPLCCNRHQARYTQPLSS